MTSRFASTALVTCETPELDPGVHRVAVDRIDAAFDDRDSSADASRAFASWRSPGGELRWNGTAGAWRGGAIVAARWIGSSGGSVSVSAVSDRATRADSGRRRSPRRWTPARRGRGRRRRRGKTRRLEGRRDGRDGDVRVARGDARVCSRASSGAGAGIGGRVVRDGVARVRGRGGGRRERRDRRRPSHRVGVLRKFRGWRVWIGAFGVAAWRVDDWVASVRRVRRREL